VSTNNYARGLSQLWTPLYSQLTLRIYTATNGLGRGAHIDFVSGRGKPYRYATAHSCSRRIKLLYRLLHHLYLVVIISTNSVLEEQVLLSDSKKSKRCYVIRKRLRTIDVCRTWLITI